MLWAEPGEGPGLGPIMPPGDGPGPGEGPGRGVPPMGGSGVDISPRKAGNVWQQQGPCAVRGKGEFSRRSEYLFDWTSVCL